MQSKTKGAVLQQDKVIWRRNTNISVRLSCLPPSSTDVRYFEYLMLSEANLVCIIRVGFVRVNCLGAIWIFRWLWYFGVILVESRGYRSTGWYRAVRAWRSTRESRQWRRRLKAATDLRRVHLGRVACSRLWSGMEPRYLRTGVISRHLLLKRIRIKELARRRLCCRPKVKYPDGLKRLASLTNVPEERTLTAHSSIKPAAAAWSAGFWLL